MADPLSLLMKLSTAEVADKIMKAVQELRKAYNEVSGDAKKLIEKMTTVESLAENVRKCSGMPGDIALCKLCLKLEESKKAIVDFTAKEKEVEGSNSVMKISTFKVKRFFIYAPEFTAKFKDLNEALDKLPEELRRIKELSQVLLKPDSLAYKDKFVNLESRKFWIDIAGTDIGQGEQSWSNFQTLYKNENPESIEWTDEEWECIRRLACTLGHNLTLFGFIFLTKQAGYPIDINKVPSILNSRSIMNETTRIKIAKMITALIKDFSSDEMNKHIVNVYKWYDSFEENDFIDLDLPKEKKEMESKEEKEARKNKEKKIIKQFKADECYKLIKQIRDNKIPEEKWSEREKMAQDVEKARRQVVYFYQQFLAICEFGRLSREIFDKVDFPGKSRLRSFIADYRPLDKANYRIIIKKVNKVDEDEWINKQPKVYTFLEEFLNKSISIEDKKKDNMKKKEIQLDKIEMELHKKQKELEDEIEKLKKEKEDFNLRLASLEEKEDLYAKKMSDLKSKEIISIIQDRVFKTKREGKQAKTSIDKFRETARTIASKGNNKVESNTSKKDHND